MPTALVTGASSGIGREFARLLAADGHNLVLTARSEQRLQELADELTARHRISVHVIAADLAVVNAAEGIARALVERELQIDFLVNNAGYGIYSAFAETSSADVLGMIQVNVVALTQLTRLLLPEMLARRTGTILNVASTAAFQPGPGMAVYFATKAFVLSFSEALADELAGSGVRVTAVCPGPIQSGFQERARMSDSKLVHGKRLPGPESAARIALQAARRGKPLVIPGFANQLFARAARLAPRKLVLWVTRNLLRKRDSSPP